MRIEILLCHGKGGLEHEDAATGIHLHVQNGIGLHESVVFLCKELLDQISAGMGQSVEAQLSRECKRSAIDPPIPANYEQNDVQVLAVFFVITDRMPSKFVLTNGERRPCLISDLRYRHDRSPPNLRINFPER